MLWRERQHLRELFVHSGSCAKRVDQLHSGEGEVVLHFVLQLSEREREQLPQSLNLPGGGLTFPSSAWPIGRTVEAHDLLLIGHHLRISGESRASFIVSGFYLAWNSNSSGTTIAVFAGLKALSHSAYSSRLDEKGHESRTNGPRCSPRQRQRLAAPPSQL